MKSGFLSFFILIHTLVFAQSGKVFEPNRNVDGYYKGILIKPTKLAVNVDFVSLAFKGQCDLGLVYSIMKNLGVEASYGFPWKENTLDETHFSDNTYHNSFTTSFMNQYGISAFYKGGTLGLSKTAYAGMGIRRRNFVSTYSGRSQDNLFYSYGNDMYWFAGAMGTLTGKLQVNLSVGAGFSKISAQENLEKFVDLSVSGQSVFMVNLKLQYAIF
ncbi:MAG: hypothetical protein KG003_04155 [Bacteroidetes bacterium]|nr:hypothetical protein [Bacteroidota bacterium]